MLKSYHTRGLVEAGCDEAGRGCIAGPVFAAAVILPPQFHNPLLNDSKKLSPEKREILRKVVEAEAIDFGVGIVGEKEIDKIFTQVSKSIPSMLGKKIKPPEGY